MGAGYFMPIALPILAGLVLLQYGTRLPLFSLATLPNLLTGFAWCMTFPRVYAWTFQSVWYQSKICFDFIVGTSGFLLLVSRGFVPSRISAHHGGLSRPAELFRPAHSVYPDGVLPSLLAQSVAGVTHGDLSDELARKHH